ncbi:MAG: magnesium transporter, partial [Bacilli bacterium]|nr:magnesium transporter [Bacilli bacterium]
ELPLENQIELAERLDVDFVAEIFEHLEQEDAIELLQKLKVELAVSIIDHMESDDAVDLLQYLETEIEGVDLLSLLSPKKRAELNKLLVYEDHEIGSVMSSSFIQLEPDMSVKEAMRKVTHIAGDTDYISMLYVVGNSRLIGYLKLKTLIVARAEEKIHDIMETSLIHALPTDDKEDVANKMQAYGGSSMPIVDDEMHLVGIVTHDDLIDIIDDALSEDYAKLAGLVDGDIDLERDSVFDSVKQRLPWLTILLFLSMITAVLLSFFEGSLTSSQGAILLSTHLAVYLPLILGMAGNTGTQSLAVMIRYLNTPKTDVSRKTLFRYLGREAGTGSVQGLLIGILVFGMVVLANMIFRHNDDQKLVLITAAVTGGSVFIALVVSTVLGALIPLGMQKASIDPAVASGPFITTITDIITLSIYYSISLAILLPLY